MDSLLMTDQPLISVLLPVYNAELFIEEALQSVLSQTYTNFECIIIDDASTDKSVEIIKSFNDNRIILIEKEQNTGYTKNLNYGITVAKGKYIARMDADDISLPTRFEKQINQFESNPSLVVCGTIFQIIDSDKIIYNPETHDAIKLAMLKDSAIGHPTAMIKSSVLKNNSINYDPTYEPAEDYNLWVKLLAHGEFYNIQEVLFLYRVHENQVSNVRKNLQRDSASKSRFKMLSYFNVPLTTNQEKAYSNLFSYTKKVDTEDLNMFLELQDAINSSNASFMNKQAVRLLFRDFEKRAISQCFLSAKQYNLKLLRTYLRVKVNTYYKLPLFAEVKLVIKSVLNLKA